MSSTFNDPGEVPVLDWLDTSAIDIDARYQRSLDEARVERILAGFAWDSFGAIVVAPVGDRFHCIDGQHRLEAAKRHPKVDHVPAVIIASRPVEGEAATFVTVNRDRKNVSGLEMYWAELAAGNPEAQTICQVAERCGMRILRSPTPVKDTKPGDTMAIGTIAKLVDTLGAMQARVRLAVLSSAALAPICSHHIRAVDLLLSDPEFCDQVDADNLLEALAGSNFEAEAKLFASTHRVPHWRAFASVWFKATRKKRKPSIVPLGNDKPTPSPVPLKSDQAAQAMRPLGSVRVSYPATSTERNVTASLLGDPSPERSALASRKVNA